MASLNITISIFYLCFGGFLLIFCLLLVKQKIPMNHFAGFRYPQAYQSDENWYKINYYGGKVTLPSAIIIIIMALFTSLTEFSHPIILFESLLLFLLMLIPTILSYNYARKLANVKLAN